MFDAQDIKHDMKVIDTQGRHIGTVNQLHDDGVELTREGFSDDLHHFVPLAAVLKIDGGSLVVEPGHATSIEAVAGAILYARRRSPTTPAIFGTSGHGTGVGGSGIGH